MLNFFLVNNTIIQAQSNISQTTISLTDCFNVVTATGPSSDQSPSPSGLLIFYPCLENITEIELSWLDLSSNDSDSMPFSGTLHSVLMGISRMVLTSWSIRHNFIGKYTPRRTIASYGTQFESMRNVLKIYLDLKSTSHENRDVGQIYPPSPLFAHTVDFQRVYPYSNPSTDPDPLDITGTNSAATMPAQANLCQYIYNKIISWFKFLMGYLFVCM